ncbi:9852_t:CDS:1 [Funneliformis geosporum]|uniref:10089_t:CDS:1 n=1 Tax=Funneliformis geosporum TaxID=1117311 RepID=A0A9W4T4R3_9GLOM|nr:10089_t:CDS:1 [Funneliformis geosporum]CAI2192549.1 9852_t:CDS:1 [Funneliformis geosporum]
MTFHFLNSDAPDILEMYTRRSRSRVPNMFMVYRAEIMKFRPDNMTMIEYSKVISQLWKAMPEKEKADRKSNFQKIRDQILSNAVQTSENSDSILVDQFNPYQTFPNETNDERVVVGQMGESSDPYPSMLVDQFNRYQTLPNAMNDDHFFAGQISESSDFNPLMTNYQFNQDHRLPNAENVRVNEFAFDESMDSNVLIADNKPIYNFKSKMRGD